MLRVISYATLGILLIVGLFIMGCAQRQSRVAGTQQSISTVAATITSSGLQLNQSQVPPGNVNLKVTNQDKTAHMVTVQGPNGFTKTTANILPGKSATINLPSLKAGSYKVFVKGMQNQAAMSKTLMVKSGATTTTTKGAAAQVVTATITSSGLQLSKNKITSSDLSMHVKNSTNKAQTVVLEGPSKYLKNTGTIQPGQTKTLALTGLAAGAYTVYVKGLENQAGMKKTLTVAPAGKVAGTTEKAGTITATLSDTNKFKFSPASMTATGITLVFKNTTGKDVSFMNQGKSSTVKQNATMPLATIRQTAANHWEITRPTAGTAATGTTPSGTAGAAKTVIISQNGDKFTISPASVTGNNIMIVFRNMGKQNATFVENGKTSTVKSNARMSLVTLRKTGTNQWEIISPSSTGTGTGSGEESGEGGSAR